MRPPSDSDELVLRAGRPADVAERARPKLEHAECSIAVEDTDGGVVAQVDGQPVTAGLMPTGSGGRMLSISAKLRMNLGKDLGDPVDVTLSERLT